MIRKNDWVCFDDGLDNLQCNLMIGMLKKKLAKSDEDTHNRHLENHKEKKKTDIVWTEEQWIYDAVWPFMLQANEEAGWKYDILSAETIQLARYKKGMFYDWHADGKGDHLSVYKNPINKMTHGRVRKLAASVFLNEDYEGGEIQFSKYNHAKPDMMKTWTDRDFPANQLETVKHSKGAVLIFPSDMWHRVRPVTKGIRYSLVMWFLGPPFI
jgi:PKHD-type hydroxylase